MVIEVYVASDSRTKHSVIGEAAAMVHVGFHRLVPGLHVRVVGHPARPVHALFQPMFQENIAISTCQIFNATVTVEDCGLGWLSGSQRMAQCPGCQCRGLLSTVRPAQDPPRVSIHDGGQLAPFSSRFQVSDITHPDLVGATDLELVRFILATGEELTQARQSPVELV